MEENCPNVGATFSVERGPFRIAITRKSERDWYLESSRGGEVHRAQRFNSDAWKAGRKFQRECDECALDAARTESAE